MNQAVDTKNVIIGAILIVAGLALYLYQRAQPARIRGFTPKQFAWGCVAIVICGIFVIVIQFVFPE